MKIGIYGGSFNPVHFGHVGLAKWVIENTDLDELWLLVSPNNPLKPASSLAPEQERLEAVRQAVKDIPHVVASDFSGHAITDSLSGTQIVLDSPFLLTQSSAVGGSGADRIEFSPLVSVSGRCIAAATERGRGIGEDLALRPTRIVVVGDSLFARNGPLASRANANMDFLLNCVAYLAGTAAITGGEVDGDVLATGMDRRGWTSFTIQSGLVVPVGLFLMMLAYVAFRRRRL